VFPLNVLSPLSFMKKYVDVVLDSEKPLVSHGNVDSMNCDIDSLQDKIELLLNTGVATIQQSDQFYYIVVFLHALFRIELKNVHFLFYSFKVSR